MCPKQGRLQYLRRASASHCSKPRPSLHRKLTSSSTSIAPLYYTAKLSSLVSYKLVVPGGCLFSINMGIKWAILLFDNVTFDGLKIFLRFFPKVACLIRFDRIDIFKQIYLLCFNLLCLLFCIIFVAFLIVIEIDRKLVINLKLAVYN